MINDHVGHPDLHEGSRAFVEKRAPRWAPYTGEAAKAAEPEEGGDPGGGAGG